MNVFPYSRHVGQCCQKLGQSLYIKHIVAMVATQRLTEMIAASDGHGPTDWAQQVKAIRDSIDFPTHECRMSPIPR